MARDAVTGRSRALPSSRSAIEVPWRERLSSRLLVAIGIAMLLVTATFFAGERTVEQVLTAQARDEAAGQAEVLRRALRRAMLADRRSEAYQSLADVAGQPGVERIRLLDAEGHVAFESPPASSGARVVTAVAPFPNEPACTACHEHPVSRQELGHLEVQRSLATAEAAVAGFRTDATWLAALLALALGISAWWFARRQLVGPIEALVAATRRAGRDGVEPEPPSALSGELGVLADAFEEMARGQRAARAELTRLVVAMEQEVARRGEALDAARQGLATSERFATLGRLSAAVAHRIMEPLAGIRTVARLVARTLEHGTPDESTRRTLRHNLALVERECDRLDEVAHNLFDTTQDRLQAAAPVDVAALVGEALGLVAHELGLRRVKVDRRITEVPRLRGDAAQLRQAVVHLLVNACEALPDGGTLQVEVSADAAGRTIGVLIADDGPGIPADRLPRIFEPFFSTKPGGSGLGLAVVRATVQRHGGQVGVESSPGKGTRVRLTFPVSPQPEGVAGATAAA